MLNCTFRDRARSIAMRLELAKVRGRSEAIMANARLKRVACGCVRQFTHPNTPNYTQHSHSIICLFVYLYIYSSVYLSISRFVYLSTSLSVKCSSGLDPQGALEWLRSKFGSGAPGNGGSLPEVFGETFACKAAALVTRPPRDRGFEISEASRRFRAPRSTFRI